MINPYAYHSSNLTVRIRPIELSRSWRQYRVEMPSLFKNHCLEETPLKGEYFQPRVEGRLPLAILVHGMGDRSVIPCRMIAKDLAKKGIASFIVYLVFNAERAPDSIKKRYPNLSAEEWDESYKISVTDVHQILDWAATRPEIIQSQVSLLGISFGSFIVSIAMALDKRVKRGILVECGGNSDKITRNSLLLRWRYKMGTEVFRQNQAA